MLAVDRFRSYPAYCSQQYSFNSEEKQNSHLVENSEEITSSIKNQEKETSTSWQSLVKCNDGLKYEYLAEIDRQDWKEYEHKKFRVRDSKVGLFYNAEEKIHEKRIEFMTLEKEKCEKSPDIMLEWDEASSSLSAKPMSDILVWFRSHSSGELRKMEKNESTTLFCLKDLHRQLKQKGTQNTFDPDETMLRLGAKCRKTATDVTLQSTAAGCLYQTFVIF